jgi:hypothetical protein
VRAQERLDESVTAAGLGRHRRPRGRRRGRPGFFSSPQPPTRTAGSGRPGSRWQWLRQGRDRLSRSARIGRATPAPGRPRCPRPTNPVAQGARRSVHPSACSWSSATGPRHRHVAERHPRARGGRRAAQGTSSSSRRTGRRPTGGRSDAGGACGRAPGCGATSGVNERRRLRAPGGPRQLRPAAGDARLLGVGGRPSGRDLFGAEWNQGPAGRRPRPSARRADLGATQSASS